MGRARVVAALPLARETRRGDGQERDDVPTDMRGWRRDSFCLWLTACWGNGKLMGQG